MKKEPKNFGFKKSKKKREKEKKEKERERERCGVVLCGVATKLYKYINQCYK